MRTNKPVIKLIKRNLPVFGYTTAALLLLVLLSFAAEKSYAVNERKIGVEGEDGYFDLRGQDFEHNYFEVSCDKFYPSQYLSLSEIDAQKSEINDRTADYGTERATLALPDDEAYILNFRAYTYAWRIYANGRLELAAGNAGTTLAETEPSVNTGRELIITPKEGVIDLVFHLANFHHVEKGVGDVIIHIAKPGFIAKYGKFDLGEPIRAAVVGALLGMALLLFSVWLTNIKIIQNLWFGLAVLFMAARQCVVSGVGQTFLSFLPGPFVIRLEYISLPLITVFMFLYLNRVFPNLGHRWFGWYVYFGTVSYFLIALFGANEFFTQCLRFWYVFFISLLVYALARLVWRFRGPANDQAVALAGFIVLVIASINDVFIYNAVTFVFGWINMSESAMLVMILTQTVALFLGNARIVAEAREAERLLAGEKASLEQVSRMKTEFLQDMSHEIQNPLSVISVGADYIHHRIDADGGKNDAHKALNTIQNEAIRIGRMVDGMVKMSVMGGSPEGRKRLDFAALLDECAEISRLSLEKKKNTLQLKIEPDLPHVYAEADKLKQTLANLFGNAAKHTQNGEILLEASSKGSYITVKVSDTGEGIQPEFLPHVFERGISGSGSSGYGLFICKTIVEAHGGTIKIASEQKKGCAVTFTIPVYSGQEESRKYE